MNNKYWGIDEIDRRAGGPQITLVLGKGESSWETFF